MPCKMVAAARAGPSQSQWPETPSQSRMGCRNAALGPPSATFPMPLARSSLAGGAAKTWASVHRGCWCCWQWLYLLCHSTSPRITCFLAVSDNRLYGKVFVFCRGLKLLLVCHFMQERWLPAQVIQSTLVAEPASVMCTRSHRAEDWTCWKDSAILASEKWQNLVFNKLWETTTLQTGV